VHRFGIPVLLDPEAEIREYTILVSHDECANSCVPDSAIALLLDDVHVYRTEIKHRDNPFLNDRTEIKSTYSATLSFECSFSSSKSQIRSSGMSKKP
jgi:hypothetical protein